MKKYAEIQEFYGGWMVTTNSNIGTVVNAPEIIGYGHTEPDGVRAFSQTEYAEGAQHVLQTVADRLFNNDTTKTGQRRFEVVIKEL